MKLPPDCPFCQKPVEPAVETAIGLVHTRCIGRWPLRAPYGPHDLFCRKCGDDGRWTPQFVWGWNVLCPKCFKAEDTAGRIGVHAVNGTEVWIARGDAYLGRLVRTEPAMTAAFEP